MNKDNNSSCRCIIEAGKSTEWRELPTLTSTDGIGVRRHARDVLYEPL